MATKEKAAPEVISDEAKDADPKDTRDTNNVPRTQLVGLSSPDAKVQVMYPDGSVETATIGDMLETHGDAMGGPTVADLNPAFAPAASTHQGANS